MGSKGQREISMTGLQEKFLKQEFWILAWNASVQRSNLYLKNVEGKARADFRGSAIQIMDIAIFQQYKSSVSEEVHCVNIEAITEAVTSTGVDVLGDIRGHPFTCRLRTLGSLFEKPASTDVLIWATRYFISLAISYC